MCTRYNYSVELVCTLKLEHPQVMHLQGEIAASRFRGVFFLGPGREPLCLTKAQGERTCLLPKMGVREQFPGISPGWCDPWRPDGVFSGPFRPLDDKSARKLELGFRR